MYKLWKWGDGDEELVVCVSIRCPTSNVQSESTRWHILVGRLCSPKVTFGRILEINEKVKVRHLSLSLSLSHFCVYGTVTAPRSRHSILLHSYLRNLFFRLCQGQPTVAFRSLDVQLQFLASFPWLFAVHRVLWIHYYHDQTLCN